MFKLYRTRTRKMNIYPDIHSVLFDNMHREQNKLYCQHQHLTSDHIFIQRCKFKKFQSNRNRQAGEMFKYLGRSDIGYWKYHHVRANVQLEMGQVSHVTTDSHRKLTDTRYKSSGNENVQQADKDKQ